MDAPLPGDLDAALSSVDELLGKINLDLQAAPAWKRRTAWWDDRWAERNRLLRQKDFLRDRKRELK
jgi:hypothetical protein